MILRFLYTLLWLLAAPFIVLRLVWRARRQPEYLQHLGERLGRYPQRLSLPVIWIHAVSVGETRASAPLVQALLDAYPDHSLLLTHMTPTGRATGEELFGRFAPRVQSAYLPYDLPWVMRRFLRHFRPSMGILMETEVWPNLVETCRRRHIPLALVNARMSERSARGYRRAGPLAREAFAHLSVIAAQTESDENRMSALGARYLKVTGNIKFDIMPPTTMQALGHEFRNRFGPRQVLLAASTREGEEELLLETFARLCPPEVLLVLVPRHPQRFGEVVKLVRKAGLGLQRRSSNDPVLADTRVWLGDSMGEMFAYYHASDVALIGGSWLPLGGQNLIEACAVGCPVVVGPHTFNFAAAAEQAIEAGAAVRASDMDDGIGVALQILQDPARRSAMGAAGQAYAQTHRGATERTLDLITPLLRAARPRR